MLFERVMFLGGCVMSMGYILFGVGDVTYVLRVGYAAYSLYCVSV